MRTHFTPDKVLAMTEVDLKQLIGKYIVVEVAASEWYKENVGGEWEGGSGMCTAAGVQNRKAEVDGKDIDVKVKFVMWDYGMGWSWTPDSVVHIHVCDEHGNHRERDKGASECLSTLGVRGREEVAGGEAEEEAKMSSNPTD